MVELEDGSNLPPRPFIDREAPEPLYHQVFLYLQDQINSGAFAKGDRFPTENELIDLLNVSRITIRRALQGLVAQGLVVRERGRGTRVAQYRAGTRLVAGVDGMLENNRRLGKETEVRLLAFEYVRPPRSIAELMGCAGDDLVQRTVRTRQLDNIPFSYAVTYVPEHIGRTYTREEIANEPLIELLERTGVKVTRARQKISACAASAEVSRALSIKFGAPLLHTIRTVFDDSGEVVEHIEIFYRSEYYQYEIELERTTRESMNEWVAPP